MHRLGQQETKKQQRGKSCHEKYAKVKGARGEPMGAGDLLVLGTLSGPGDVVLSH